MFGVLSMWSVFNNVWSVNKTTLLDFLYISYKNQDNKKSKMPQTPFLGEYVSKLHFKRRLMFFFSFHDFIPVDFFARGRLYVGKNVLSKSFFHFLFLFFFFLFKRHLSIQGTVTIFFSFAQIIFGRGKNHTLDL